MRLRATALICSAVVLCSAVASPVAASADPARDRSVATHRPTLSGPHKARFTVGTRGSVALTVTGSPRPTVDWFGKLPAGVHAHGATLSGTPKAAAVGRYVVVAQARNGVGDAAQHTVVLTVVAAP